MALVWMQPLLLRRYLGVIFVVTRASRRSLSDLRGRRMNDTTGFCAKLIPMSDYIQTIFFESGFGAKDRIQNVTARDIQR